MPDEERKFHLVRFLARGGQADVHIVREIRTGLHFVAKLLREYQDPVQRNAFSEEARRQIACASSRIVPVVAVNLDATQPFIILPYVQQGTLADAIEARSHSPWHPFNAVVTVLRVAEAVADAHRRRYIHRDVKPGNVLLLGDGRLMLSDFGLAASISFGFIRGRFLPGGTYIYAAPEQWQGVVHAANDIYPLGVMLAELATGVPMPYNRNRGVWPSQVHSVMGPVLDDLAMTFTNPNWRARPTAAQAVRQLRMAAARLTAMMRPPPRRRVSLLEALQERRNALIAEALGRLS